MTGQDGTTLARNLAIAARGAIATAVGTAAGRAAEAIGAGAPETAATAVHTGDVGAVNLTGPGLFAREFGALDSAADPVIAPAVRRLKRRPA